MLFHIPHKQRSFTKSPLSTQSQNTNQIAVFLEPVKTCARASLLIKFQAEACNFVKNRLWRRCFLVNYAKFLRTPIFIEHFRWMLLNGEFWRIPFENCSERGRLYPLMWRRGEIKQNKEIFLSHGESWQVWLFHVKSWKI